MTAPSDIELRPRRSAVTALHELTLAFNAALAAAQAGVRSPEAEACFKRGLALALDAHLSAEKLEESKTPNRFQQSVVIWMEARERCEHYHGFKETDESIQCSHPHARTDWCGFSTCPILKTEADHHGVE